MTHGKNKKNFSISSAEEFIAAITQHIPDQNFQLVRYYGWYSNTPCMGVLFLVPVLCGGKCLEGNFNFIISIHSSDFLFFMTGNLE